MKDYESFFKEKSVLITGGAGFVGSNLAHRLVQLDAHVEIVDSLIELQGGNESNLDGIIDKIKFHKGDVRDELLIDKLVKDKDFIFNLAAQTGHKKGMEDPFLDLDINGRGSLVLLEACRKFNSNVKIVYTGSRSQYGKILYTPVDERHPMNSADTNGISKLAGEKYHFLYNSVYGIKTTSLRLTNTFGPRHVMKHAKLGFINWFIRLAMDGKEIQVFEGVQKRDINYVDDVVGALLMVAVNDESVGEAFNLGTGEFITILDLAKLIVRVAGTGSFKVVPYPKDRAKIEIGDHIADITKIKNVIGWTPEISIQEGLERTVEYYRVNKSKYW